jgi:hypothetical protein
VLSNQLNQAMRQRRPGPQPQTIGIYDHIDPNRAQLP